MSIRRLLAGVVAVELLLAATAIGWRVSRPAPPRPDLRRLPDSTAGDLRRLAQAVWADRPAAWLELGEAYLAFGYFPEAEICLKHAVALDAESREAAYAWAYALERLGRIADANRQWERTAALGEQPQACWYHIGRNRLRQEDTAGAEQAFEKAEGHAAAAFERARLKVRQGRPAEALLLVETLQKNLDLDVRVEMLAATAHRELHQPREELKALERSERAAHRLMVSDHLEYLGPIRVRYGMDWELARSEALAKEGDDAGAFEVLQAVIDRHPLDHSEQLLVPAVELAMKTKSDVLTFLARHERRRSLAPRALDVRAGLENDDDAIATSLRVSRMLSLDLTHFRLASLYDRRKQTELAQRHRAEGYFLMGVDLYRNNLLEGAASKFDRVKSVLRGDPRYWYAVGNLHLAQNNVPLARSDFRRCLELDPHHGRARERLQALGD